MKKRTLLSRLAEKYWRTPLRQFRQLFGIKYRDWGEVDHESEMGRCLCALGRSSRFSRYVEVGSAAGKGSTRRLMDGILPRNDDSALWSVECDPIMHDIAKNNWRGSGADGQLRFIHGSIVRADEIMTPDEAKTHPLYHLAEISSFVSRTWQKHYDAIAAAPDATDELPESIDVLFLDGGEFSSHAEFIKLHPRSRVIVLDDSHRALKNYLVRETLRRDPDWKMILDRPNGRPNGWCIFCRTTEEDAVRSILAAAEID